MDHPDNEALNAGIKGGKYVIDHKAPSGSFICWMNGVTIDPAQDFRIKTRLKQVSGDGKFGFVWGGTGIKDFYGFLMTSGGEFRLYKYKNGKYGQLHPYTAIGSAFRSKGNSNVLEVIKKDHEMIFRLNETVLLKTDFQHFYGDRLGYVVYNKIGVEVESLDIWQTQEMEIVLREDFEKPTTTWSRGENEIQRSGVENGYYMIQCKKANEASLEFKEVTLDPGRDYEIHTRIRQIGGDPESGFGVALGEKNSTDSYTMVINSYGDFQLFRWNNGLYDELKEWSDGVDFINPSKESNKFSIVKEKNTTKFLLNGETVYKTQMKNFDISKVGFVVYDSATIAVEDVLVKQVKPYEPKLPPSIMWVTPDKPSQETNNQQQIIKAKVNSSSKLGRATLFVNNEMIRTIDFDLLKRDANRGYQGALEQVITLKEGQNNIKIIAKAKNGLVTTESRNINLVLGDRPDRGEGKDYALFFCTDDYEHWGDLVNPDQ